MTQKSINLLDCTLRDGGYYNNWDFKVSFINDYLKLMSTVGINNIEIGFRSLRDDNSMGECAYSRANFLNSLRIPQNLRIGVMVNASDFFYDSLSYKKKLTKYFKDINSSNISFIRIASHLSEVKKILPIIKWFKKKGVLVTVNLMQISELKSSGLKVKNLCKMLDRSGLEVLYLADSLGCLRPSDIKKIFLSFMKYWKKEMGLHAHDNLGLAFKNSLAAISCGATWIDSTLTGMGRGPGNLTSEEIVKNVFKDSLKNKKINKFNKTSMLPLKKKYKWGKNKFYHFSALHKIHPTYVQKVLADPRYDRKNYMQILKDLKNQDAKKFNPLKLILSSNIYSQNPKAEWHPVNSFKDKEILIIGSGDSVKKSKTKIINFINQKNIIVIVLNSNQIIPEKFINFRAVCHPLRIISDSFFFKQSKTNLISPYSMLDEKLKVLLNSNNKLIMDFGLKIGKNGKIKVEKNYFQFSQPLAVAYAIGTCLSGKAKNIFLAGFDGFKSNDSRKDDTLIFLKKLKKFKKHTPIKFITKSSYDIKF